MTEKERNVKLWCYLQIFPIQIQEVQSLETMISLILSRDDGQIIEARKWKSSPELKQLSGFSNCNFPTKCLFLVLVMDSETVAIDSLQL